MDNLNGLLKELKTLVGGTDEANRRRFTEILDELEAHKNEPKVQAQQHSDGRSPGIRRHQGQPI